MNKIGVRPNTEFSQPQLVKLKVEPTFDQIRQQVSNFAYSTHGYKIHQIYVEKETIFSVSMKYTSIFSGSNFQFL